ncbi:MAG: hypothetical protein EOO65_02425 [Methanosarcinales archaeon]|nr:MAG: hypothetical protein EOO65_02425 [Methanosarcinales archaeon]
MEAESEQVLTDGVHVCRSSHTPPARNQELQGWESVCCKQLAPDSVRRCERGGDGNCAQAWEPAALLLLLLTP